MLVRASLAASVPLLLLAAPPAAAPPPTKMVRIGVLSPGFPFVPADTFGAFRQGLRDLGYVEGRNLTIEWRFAKGQAERLPDLAADLVRANVDVIVPINMPAARPRSSSFAS